jgi:multimeric flavodoxin WrbA
LKLVIVHGASHRGSTWHFSQMLLEALEQRTQVEAREFYLPKDMPQLCLGCFNCFMKGEDTCPHAALVAPIAEATAEADVIVLTSPVYALEASGGMKALLDHLCYRWVVHRPDPRMFQKVGVTVSTTAGAGLKNATRTLRNSLRFWGVRHAFSMKQAVAAADWSEVSEKNRARMQKQAERTAERVLRAPGRRFGSSVRRFAFLAIRSAMRKGAWNERDRVYWREMGWLDGGNPFKD